MAKEIGYYFCNKYNFPEFKGKENEMSKEEADQSAIIGVLRTKYKEANFDKETLNEHLMILENKKIKLTRLNQNSLFTSLISVIMSLLGAALSIIISTNSLVIGYQTKLAKEGETTELKALGQEIIDAIGTNKSYIVFMCVVVIIIAIVVAGIAIREIIIHYNDININSIINIHKKVIEEKLEELKKKDERIKVLEEIKNTLKGAGRETETLRRIFEKK